MRSRTPPRPAPEISEETQRLLATDASELDRELLEIYLFEAAEVLDGVAQNHKALLDNPGDREALRTVRRGFHTLKGSGRMVGLAELGEYAYDAERVVQPPARGRATGHERRAGARRYRAPELPGVGRCAATRGQRVTADPRALRAAIAAVERELPGAPPVPVAAPPPPSNVIELPRPAQAPPHRGRNRGP